MQKRSSKKTENFLTKNIVGQNQEKPKISEQLDQIKKKLRIKAKGIRKGLSVEERKQAAQMICSQLVEWFEKSQISRVYCYYPLGNEANILELTRELLKKGIAIAFPKVFGEDMIFYEIHDFEYDFAEGSFHIMEPCTEEIADWPDACVLVPGLGFDLAGNRLGYGKGYYDRYFSTHEYQKLIGVAYEASVFEQLPSQGRDLKMDFLCTEERLYCFK